MSIPKTTNEQKILFDFLKGDLPQTLEGCDTILLFDLFRRHRLFPMASALLPMMKEEEKEEWKKAIQSKTIRSMHQLAVLGQINEALENAGIESISMKGPVLAHDLFGNMGGRHSSDLDLLVREDDIQAIIEILGSKGFELSNPKTGLSARQWSYYSRYKKDIGLFSKTNKILVEVHHSIENNMGMQSAQVDQFLEQAHELTIGGQSFRTMNRHQNFLYLAFHGAVHQYRRLFWLRDIAEALNKWELDHQKILEDAQKLGIARMLGVSLQLAAELFAAEIPVEYTKYLEEEGKAMEKLKHMSMALILGPEFPNFRGKLMHHSFMLRSKPELRHYLRTAKEILNRQYIGKFLGGH